MSVSSELVTSEVGTRIDSVGAIAGDGDRAVGMPTACSNSNPIRSLPEQICLAEPSLFYQETADVYTPDAILPLAEKLAPVRLGGRYTLNEAPHTKSTQLACGKALKLIPMEFTMTTKILTVRIPSSLYTSLCEAAGEAGMPISAHVRRQLERENEGLQLAALRGELLSRLDSLALTAVPAAAPVSHAEVLLLCRAVAAHLNPQLVAQVRAKLASQPQ